MRSRERERVDVTCLLTRDSKSLNLTSRETRPFHSLTLAATFNKIASASE